FGPNEAGKTTLLQFLRSMFFGYADEETRRYLPTAGASAGIFHAGTRAGGSMTLVAGGTEYHLRRYAPTGDGADPMGDLRLTARNGDRVGTHRFATLLSGVDATIFQNVFAVGLREIQQLATLDDTEAARQLYNLSTGTDRVSLVDIMRQLRTTMARLNGPRESEDDSYLGQLHSALQRLRQQAASLGSGMDRWSHVRSQWAVLDAERTRLETAVDEVDHRIRRAELAHRVLPKHQELQRVRKALTEIGSPRPVPDELLAQLSASGREITGHRQRVDELQKTCGSLQERRENLDRSDGVPRGSTRIEEALDQRGQLQRLAERLDSLRIRRDDLALEIEAEQERLGLLDAKVVPTKERGQVMDVRHLRALVDPARELELQTELLTQAKAECDRVQAESGGLAKNIANILEKDPELFDADDAKDLIAAVQRTGEMAHALRERVQGSRQRAHWNRLMEQSQSRRADAYRNQLLPADVLLGLGILFSGGVFLILWALCGDWFGMTSGWRQGIGTLGGLLAGGAGILKACLDHATRGDLERWKASEAKLHRELQALQQRELAVQKATATSGRATIRLEDAEARLARLESLLPLESQRRELQRRSARCQRQ
ncbi:MAG TPA: AAA family ATPase, partial [Pirellulaceae bacterium]